MANKKPDNAHCANCGRPIVFIIVSRPHSQYVKPQGEHKKDTSETDEFLEARWLSDTSIRDRRRELAERCTYKVKA